MGDHLRFFSSASPESSRGHGHTPDPSGPEFAGPWGEPGMYSQDDYIQMARDEMERLISTDGPTTSWLYSDYYSQAPQGGNYGPGAHPPAPPTAFQRKLDVGAVNDPLEKEADEVAGRVMRNPRDCYLDPPVSPFQPRPVRERISTEMYDEQEPEAVQLKAEAPEISRTAERDEEMQPKFLQRNLAGMDDDAKETLGYTHAFEKSDDEEDMGSTTSLYMQRDMKGTGPDGGPVSPDLEERIQGVRNSGGEKLPESEREFFESRMGHDFGNVRIHTGSEAAQVSRDVNAKAFTVGRDVVFGEDEYKPGTPEGRRLMAHELTHTVQQGAAGELKREPAKGDKITPHENSASEAQAIMEAVSGFQTSGKRFPHKTENMEQYPMPWVGQMDEAFGPEKTRSFVESYFRLRQSISGTQKKLHGWSRWSSHRPPMWFLSFPGPATMIPSLA